MMGFSRALKRATAEPSSTQSKKAGTKRDNFDNELDALGQERRASILGNGNDRSATGAVFSSDPETLRKRRDKLFRDIGGIPPSAKNSSGLLGGTFLAASGGSKSVLGNG